MIEPDSSALVVLMQLRSVPPELLGSEGENGFCDCISAAACFAAFLAEDLFFFLELVVFADAKLYGLLERFWVSGEANTLISSFCDGLPPILKLP